MGPVWTGGNNNEYKLLANAYRNSLKLAAENNIERIAFPSISTGIYHFPKKLAAAIALAEARKFTAEDVIIKEVIFICFDEENYEIYKKATGEQ